MNSSLETKEKVALTNPWTNFNIEIRMQHFEGGGTYFIAALHAGLEVRGPHDGECAAMGGTSR